MRTNNYKLMLVFISLLFMINLVSAADYLTQKQNTNFDLVVQSNNGTACILSYIQYPNGVQSIFNIPLTKDGQTFYLTISSTNYSQIGNICHGVTCTDGSSSSTGSVCREITYTGEMITMEQSYIYIFALAFLVLISLGIVFIIGKLPAKDARDETGAIIQISMLKHLRPVLWIVIWGLSLAMFFIISNLGIAYLPNAMIGNLFFAIYRVAFYITIIGVPIYFIWIFYSIFADKETQKLIESGVEIRTP